MLPLTSSSATTEENRAGTRTKGKKALKNRIKAQWVWNGVECKQDPRRSEMMGAEEVVLLQWKLLSLAEKVHISR